MHFSLGKMGLFVFGVVAGQATAATFPGSLLLAKKSASIPRNGAIVVLPTARAAKTAVVRVGVTCENRGVSVREVVTAGTQWKGRNTGRWDAPAETSFSEIRLTAVPTGIGKRDAQCTFAVYDGSDKSYDEDALTTGQINFVSINNQNQLAVRDCLNKQVAKALADHGVNDAAVKVWLPPSSGDAANQLLFSVGATEGAFGGASYGFTLVLLAGERWAYSSIGGGIGPVPINAWSYQAKSMNRLAYALANDGSGQPLFRVDAGACWAN